MINVPKPPGKLRQVLRVEAIIKPKAVIVLRSQH